MILAIADNIISRRKKKKKPRVQNPEKNDLEVDVKSRPGGKGMKMFELVHSG